MRCEIYIQLEVVVVVVVVVVFNILRLMFFIKGNCSEAKL